MKSQWGNSPLFDYDNLPLLGLVPAGQVRHFICGLFKSAVGQVAVPFRQGDTSMTQDFFDGVEVNPGTAGQPSYLTKPGKNRLPDSPALTEMLNDQ